MVGEPVEHFRRGGTGEGRCRVSARLGEKLPGGDAAEYRL